MLAVLRRSSRFSKTLALLLVVFALASGMGYLVVRNAVTKTVEHQAVAIAQIVTSQASAARSVYASEIAGKLSRDGFGPSVDFEQQPGHVPIPAQFLKLVGRASEAASDRLYAYRPVSKWNLEPSQGLADEFLRWAWPQLEQQDQAAPTGPIDWKPVYRFEQQDGVRVLRYLAADPASQMACASCHNAYEQRPQVVALRRADGVLPGRQFTQHQLLGALSVTIPLERTQQLAGTRITQATVFFFGILLSSFLALMWFVWSLRRQRASLSETLLELASSERRARDANELLQARQGVEQAFTELSTYMQGIDQHALVSVTDPEGRILQVNAKFEQISGYEGPALQGRDHRLLSSGFHDSAFFGQMWETIRRGDIWRDVVCNRSRQGVLYWVDLAIVPLKDASGRLVRFIAVGIDITEQRAHEEALRYQAAHDALTDLPNRALLLHRVTRAITRATPRPHPVVLFLVNLDKFKQINESQGLEAGDEVLRAMARRLQELVRGGATVARLGSDEFVVLSEGLAREAVEPFGVRILTALQAPVALNGQAHALGASVGVALFPDHGADAETLLQCADVAMAQAKRQSQRGVCIFSREMQDEIDARVRMEARLREAIGKGELVLHYQPQVDIETGALVSLEALLRWNSPEYGFLTPGHFIALAEQSQLIGAIDAFVLDAACRQIQQWHQSGHGWVRTAVNLAATKFSDPHFKTELSEALQRYQIPAGVLELEVTESLAMRDPEAALALMRELKGLGILLAVDDFGTGYSNLAYLKLFPADRLKVDQSFVRGLLNSPQDRAIVAAVVRLAHNLNMRAIAEGVESEAEAIELYALDVDEIQGYWTARPQPPEQVESLFGRALLLDPTKFLRRDERPTVLLVEDEDATRDQITHLLEALGAQVVSVADAEQAQLYLYRQGYTMAIVDHGLPGSSGMQLLGQLRKTMPQTVRVLMTASDDPQLLRDAINIGGVAHFLAKPVEPEALRKVLLDADWSNSLQPRTGVATD